MAVTDLTGTKWLVTGFEYDEFKSDQWSYDIEFSSNNEEFVGLSFEYTYSHDPLFYWGTFSYGGNAIVPIDESSGGVVEIPSEYQIIEITGGTDVTNTDLIAWLEENGSDITPEPTETNTFSFGNLPIANMYFGTRQVKKVYLGNALVWEK